MENNSELPSQLMEDVKEVDGVKNRSESKKSFRKRKKTKNKMSSYLTNYGCFVVSEKDENGSLEFEAEDVGQYHKPSHLIIMVNGIIGSASDWRYAAKQFMVTYPRDVIVHCSQSNYSTLTFDGVDVMGERLADEVISVINSHHGLQKISFVAHSLGGLIARYAIAKLYERDPARNHSQENGNCIDSRSTEEKFKGKIAGLEPMSFITYATPHLSSRGHKRVPMFCGFYSLEKFACLASGMLGRTGKHLFLTDGDGARPPLLLQMVNDYEDLQFMSALRSFRRRVAYANSRCDYLVGWCTSSIRRPNELPELKHKPRDDKYPHIANVEPSNDTANSQQVPPKSRVSRGNVVRVEGSNDTANSQQVPPKSRVSRGNIVHVEEVLEEMVKGLKDLSWERVDVCFCGIKQKILAHSTIQGKLIAQGREMSRNTEASQTEKEEQAMLRAQLIGSRPPRCEFKCSSCRHCMAIQVPVVPLPEDRHGKHFRAQFHTVGHSRGDDITNYKPLSWKCKCGNYIFSP